jgi:DNA-binding NarL/FixJ family response regulator
MVAAGRQRQEARRHLRAAVDLFHQLRALPWEDRAAAELRATGETVRKRDLSAVEQLTAQELQIAGLITDGLANAEIAARLFLSPGPSNITCRRCSPSSASPPAAN